VTNSFEASAAFVHAARAIALSTIGRAILQIVACATPGVNAFACAAVGAGLTLAAGGTLKQAFIGAAIAFVQIGGARLTVQTPNSSHVFIGNGR
jgi:hypothetical protein